jgi:hypothetical protein
MNSRIFKMDNTQAVEVILKERVGNYGAKLDQVLEGVEEIKSTLNKLERNIAKQLDSIHGHLLDFMASENSLFPKEFVLIPVKSSFFKQEKFYKKYTLYFACEKKGCYHIMMNKEFGYELTEVTKLGFGVLFLSKVPTYF